jgi:glyoxylase-like metal-dependent hydrolase (beta-lactamase superfamily II)
VPEGIHRFTIGSYQCVAINDSLKDHDDTPGDRSAGWEFVNASPDEVKRVFDAHASGDNAWSNDSACSCLFIDTGTNRVLIDTGSGERALPDGGLLLQRLGEAGIDPASIDTVILTHGHWDHIGANADADGNPLFPNARYLMTEDEFRHWTEQPPPFGGQIDELGRSYADAYLLRMRDRFTFVASNAEIVPGFTAMPAPGHTPGQIALVIQDGNARLFCTADTFHHPCELVEPEWYFDFDHDPATTVETRRRNLQWAADEQVLVHVYHFPFPGLGRIESAGKHWEWVRP